MGITVRWDEVMDRVILMTYRGPWTWEEYDEAASEMQGMIATVGKRVDRIADLLSNVLILPPAFGKLASEAASRLDSRLALTVVVGNDINREILNALAANDPTFHERYIFAPSIGEARKLIADSRGQPPSNGHSH